MTAVSSGAAEVTGPVPEASATENPRLAILLAMAMFVLVVDTSIMNVSISSVVRDLGTTVSDVQAAIALEAVGKHGFLECDMPQAYCGAPAEATAEEGQATLATLAALVVEAVVASLP